MTSLNVSICLLFLLFIIISETEGKHVDKIIIHVPYKIHKHHHIHTKYKVITVPSKKEKTIIYIKPMEKAQKQPLQHKYLAFEDMEMQMTKTQPKEFITPHQLSGISYLQGLKQEGKSSPTQLPQSPQLTENHSQNDALEGLNFKHPYKQVVSSNKDFIPNYSFKPMFPYLHNDYTSKYSFKPMTSPPKVSFENDNSAHTSNQVYKTLITPQPSRRPSYLVKEVNQEDQHMQSTEERNKFSNHLLKQMPSLKPYQRQKQHYLKSAGKYRYKKFKPSIKMPEEEPEYEHIGYLVIDGDSQKIVGKKFKEFHSWR